MSVVFLCIGSYNARVGQTFSLWHERQETGTRFSSVRAGIELMLSNTAPLFSLHPPSFPICASMTEEERRICAIFSRY